MKVGKEEIIGVLAALEYWSKADLNALNAEWKSRVERTKKLVDTVPGVTTAIAIPTGGNSYPTLSVQWDEARFGLTVDQCAEQMRAGEPRIEVLTNNNPSLLTTVHEGMPNPEPRTARAPRPNRISIISMTLQPGEDVIVGNRLSPDPLNNARDNLRERDLLNYGRALALLTSLIGNNTEGEGATELGCGCFGYFS